MLTFRLTNKFKKDLKTVQKRKYDKKLLDDVINMLINQQELPAKYKDHFLTGNYKRM